METALQWSLSYADCCLIRNSPGTGVAALPNGVRWSHITVVGMVGGIGFTMALFIAQLAFPAGPLLEMAKFAILCGSGLAGILSLFAGYRILKPDHGSSIAMTEGEAEASTRANLIASEAKTEPCPNLRGVPGYRKIVEARNGVAVRSWQQDCPFSAALPSPFGKGRR